LSHVGSERWAEWNADLRGCDQHGVFGIKNAVFAIKTDVFAINSGAFPIGYFPFAAVAACPTHHVEPRPPHRHFIPVLAVEPAPS
jgi:hypothetical protein